MFLSMWLEASWTITSLEIFILIGYLLSFLVQHVLIFELLSPLGYTDTRLHFSQPLTHSH